jgi:prepilin-type N-terminal cleavage/methylation domain-containing protein
MVAITRAPRAQDERGFSLIEVIAAIAILTAGLLPLVGLFGVAVQQMGASTPMMIAREKAREAIESVHAARDTGQPWSTIRNVADGGVFDNNATAIKDPGMDGLVNTADDGADQWPDSLFTREIDITDLLIDGTATVHPSLRQITVIIRYRVNQAWRTYTLVTYVSSYS